MDATQHTRNGGDYIAISDVTDHTTASDAPTTTNGRSSAWSTAPSDAMRAKQRARTEWTSAKFIAYGVGHVLNDMCASTWFSYLLVFLRQVRLLAVNAALVSLLLLPTRCCMRRLTTRSLCSTVR